MLAYRRLQRSQLASATAHGLLRADDPRDAQPSVARADAFLNAHRPRDIAQLGLDRTNCIYCYLGHNGEVLDIRDGTLVEANELVDEEHVVLKLELDPQRSFVSDLDIYDELKASLRDGFGPETAQLAAQYWAVLEPLAVFDVFTPIWRPEVLVSYDVPPESIVGVVD